VSLFHLVLCYTWLEPLYGPVLAFLQDSTVPNVMDRPEFFSIGLAQLFGQFPGAGQR
jgi:hypothetical protein